ncbi:hypothetical protein EYF80_023449 [Liparis tanakae]|uniref:Uncharacterized protein n=1 Tax=Liparis tanakae TaxID=230148 RepID=A0A4Z2HMX0_9TELE|nr:hypothetical protein EYF80_023449 [Liparis tanakae]
MKEVLCSLQSRSSFSSLPGDTWTRTSTYSWDTFLGRGLGLGTRGSAIRPGLCGLVMGPELHRNGVHASLTRSSRIKTPGLAGETLAARHKGPETVTEQGQAISGKDRGAIQKRKKKPETHTKRTEEGRK